MAFSTHHLRAFLRGAILVGLPDSIPQDAVRLALNVRTDRTLGTITNRPGWTQQTASAIVTSPVMWLSKLFGSSTDYSYAQIGSLLYRLTDSWASPASISIIGASHLSDANLVDGKGGIWKHAYTASAAVKDNGTTTQNIGIVAPTATPQAVALAADLSTTIDALDATTGWTTTSLGGFATEGTIKQQGTNSLTFTVAASTVGSLTKNVGSPLNLDTLTSGDATVKDDDYIHLWVRIDRPERLEYLQIDFDLDAAGGYNTNVYTVRLNPLTRLARGADQWTKLQVRKSEFTRVGTSTDTWANVRHARLRFVTNALGSITVYIDDFKLRGGVGLEGDITYTVAYRNSVTGARSNPPKDAEGVVLYTTALTVDRQRVTLTLTNVAQGGAAHPGDTQIDTLMIWRRTPNFTEAVLVDEIADTTGSYTDTTSDSTLALNPTNLETDNDPPPTGTTRVLFGPDAQGHFFLIINGHRLYSSKPFEDGESRGENWPSLQFALIGDGSRRATAGIATDTEVYIWDESQTFQLLGSGAETFLPVALPNSHECVGQYAVAAGAGRIFFVANDGVYEQLGGQQRKITSAIDPFFNGVTVDGHLPMSRNTTLRAGIRLAYYPDPQSDCLVMLYPEEGSVTINKSLVVKRHLQTGEFTEVYFGSSTLTSLRALYVDTEANEILAGGANGQVYKIEDTTVESDAGTGIPIQVRTKSLDFDQPQSTKKLASVSIEGNTNSAALTVTAYYGRNATSEALTAMTTSTLNAISYHAAADPLARVDDVAIDIAGTVTARTTISRIACDVELMPPALEFVDSGLITFAQLTAVKYLEIDLYAPSASVTVRFYASGQLKHTHVIAANARQHVVRVYGPGGYKGFDVRVTMTSSAAFEVHNALLFHKPFGTSQGWQSREIRTAT